MVGKLQPETTAMLLCDMQERFASLYWRMGTVVQTCRYMISVAGALNIPVLATQQNSKRFGNIIDDCFADKSVKEKIAIYEKKQFSMLIPDVKADLDKLKKESYIIMGIETHVCVQHTCLDLLEQGAAVHIIVDGVTSQQALDRQVALGRLQQAGAFLTTAQSAVFMLMQTEDHPSFKSVFRLTFEHTKLPNEFNKALLK